MKTMIYQTCVLLVIFLFFSLAARAATTQELTTVDILGYTCVTEEDLDAAFFNEEKGGSVPQTCITETPVKDCESLTPLLGREASYDQCMTHSYRYLSWSDPDRSTGWGWNCGDCDVTPYVPPVPLPASWLLLLGALIALPFMIGIGGLKILEMQDENP